MNKTVRYITMIAVSAFFVGCVPAQGPKSPTRTPNIGSPVQTAEYGYPPRNYQRQIQNYFANKLKRANGANYTFSKPQRAYKRKGLAYGGEIAWKGWMVDVRIETPSRTGRMQTPKPYMVLFSDSVIVEEILGTKHTLLTRVTN
jgi:hypothetical protein